jgi:putative tryptophan/tyrosine transport system substrate-binding protein
MRRRDILSAIAGVATSWPLAAGAQQGVPVLGHLASSSLENPSGPFPAFLGALKQAGFELGRTIRLEARYADFQLDRLPALAAELVNLPCSVIIASGGPRPALTLRSLTSTIPIVFAPLPDPVRSGLVASLNRPGANITGVAAMTIELDPKRIELLHELTTASGSLGVMYNPTRPDSKIQIDGIQSAAKAVGREIVLAQASAPHQIDAAFAEFKERSIAGLLVSADPFFSSRRSQIVGLAAQHGWPAMYQWREFVDIGGYASFGASLTDQYRQVGFFVARILKGEKPADLPVQQPTRFEFVVNLRTARALGRTVPLPLLARADDIVE